MTFKFTPEQQQTLIDAAEPLIKWLNENRHPHCHARVDQDSVTVSEDVVRSIPGEFVRD